MIRHWQFIAAGSFMILVGGTILILAVLDWWRWR